jgi:hypothetical protein
MLERRWSAPRGSRTDLCIVRAECKWLCSIEANTHNLSTRYSRTGIAPTLLRLCYAYGRRARASRTKLSLGKL